MTVLDTIPEAVESGVAVDADGGRWVAVCGLDDLAPERGAAALVEGVQVALVRLLDDEVLAVQQHDPFSDAHVLARGIVGSRLVDGVDVPTIASPMYKQVFDLRTGRCLDRAGKEPVHGLAADLRTWPVRVVEGTVLVGPVDPVGTVGTVGTVSTAGRPGTASDGPAADGES